VRKSLEEVRVHERSHDAICMKPLVTKSRIMVALGLAEKRKAGRKCGVTANGYRVIWG
jgi:hypothetical protein